MTRRTDWQGLGAALLLALGLHALLARTLRATPPPHRPEPPAALQTRTLPQAPDMVPVKQEASPPPRRPRTASTHAAVAEPAPPPPAPALLATAPALHWHYRLRQGEELGEARLRWAPAATAYQAQLERRLGERALPAWHSSGVIEAGGLAPERFVQASPGRAGQATNFRREQGLISFSAGSELVPLPPGAQDRLSWMLHSKLGEKRRRFRKQRRGTCREKRLQTTAYLRLQGRSTTKTGRRLLLQGQQTT